MATIQQEIMSIAEAQGYEGKSSGTIAEAVNALGTVMGGGGSGGAEPFFVTFTNSGPNYSCDKTVDEIVEAAASGKLVVGIYKSKFDWYSHGFSTFRFMPADIDNSDSVAIRTVTFWYVEVRDTHRINLVRYIVDANGTCTQTDTFIQGVTS